MVLCQDLIKGVGKVEADGVRTPEGFVVLQGSHIAVEDDDTIPAVLKEQRRKVSIVDMFSRKMFCFQVHHMQQCL